MATSAISFLNNLENREPYWFNFFDFLERIPNPSRPSSPELFKRNVIAFLVKCELVQGIILPFLSLDQKLFSNFTIFITKNLIRRISLLPREPDPDSIVKIAFSVTAVASTYYFKYPVALFIKTLDMIYDSLKRIWDKNPVNLKNVSLSIPDALNAINYLLYGLSFSGNPYLTIASLATHSFLSIHTAFYDLKSCYKQHLLQNVSKELGEFKEAIFSSTPLTGLWEQLIKSNNNWTLIHLTHISKGVMGGILGYQAIRLCQKFV